MDKRGRYIPYGDTIKYWDRPVKKAKDLGLAIHFMPFIYRNKAFFKDSLQIAEFALRYDPKSLLLNIEGPGLRGSATIDDYKKYFADIFRVCERLGAVVIPPFSKILNFALDEYLDYVMLECYSFWSRDGTRLWSHTDKMFPGEFQKNSVDRFFVDHPDVKRSAVIVGLANYDLDRPTTTRRPSATQSENVIRCFRAVKDLGIAKTSVWSLPHFIGKSKEKQELRELFTAANSGNLL